MPAYQAPSRDLRFDTREPLDLSRLAGHDRPLQAGEPVAAELRDTVVEAGASFCVTHACVSVPSSASLKQSPAV